jgi:tRNA pseudouridine38-40 synthase
MVRNIVGTLVNVGLRKITAADFKKILDSRDRSQAGMTAPARGLTLVKVHYR